MHHSQILIIFSIVNWPGLAPGDSPGQVIGGASHCERDILLNMEILLRSCLAPCVGTDDEQMSAEIMRCEETGQWSVVRPLLPPSLIQVFKMSKDSCAVCKEAAYVQAANIVFMD